MSVACEVAGICGGCPWILKPYDAQLNEKIEGLRKQFKALDLPENKLADIHMYSIAEAGLRDRVDMTLHRVDGRMRFGLYDIAREEIVDLVHCPQMSLAIKPWFDAFRADLPDLALGSARLRVAPDGRFGLWLDFPNTEIKRFLDEETWLSRQNDQAHVEMGQRRKTVHRDESGRLRLRDPELKPWFETYLGSEQRPQPLYCSVGGFTQPGFLANRKLVACVRDKAAKLGVSRWLELGAGIGNFTLPLAAEGSDVIAVENDRRACDGLERSAAEAGLMDRIQIQTRNMHRAEHSALELLASCDGLLADPPRSGLRAFADLIVASETKPAHFIYVSCFAESLAIDLAKLCGAGYRIQSLEGLDQFPQSAHCEWIVHLSR